MTLYLCHIGRASMQNRVLEEMCYTNEIDNIFEHTIKHEVISACKQTRTFTTTILANNTLTVKNNWKHPHFTANDIR